MYTFAVSLELQKYHHLAGKFALKITAHPCHYRADSAGVDLYDCWQVFGPLFDIFGAVLIATGFLSYGFGLDPLSEMWGL